MILAALGATRALAVEALDRDMVAVKRLDVRAGPALSYAVVETLPRGMAVRMTGKVKEKAWYRVALLGRREGFVPVETQLFHCRPVLQREQDRRFVIEIVVLVPSQ